MDFVGIGAAARRFGLAESALRYWERRGLLRPVQLGSGWRRYGPDELHRIGLIQMWRETATLSLDEIALILAARNHDWRRVVSGRIHTIEDQQDRLARAKEHLEHLLTCPHADPAQDCLHLRAATAAASGSPRSAGLRGERTG
ncbi:MerR family transcriptional regulator [Mycobacterium sp. BMJ-28]